MVPGRVGKAWWSALKVQHKVGTVLVLLLTPLLLGILTYLHFIQQLLVIQEERHDALVVREQLHVLRRLAIDIDDALQGYVLTREQRHLILLANAKTKLDAALREQAHLPTMNHWAVTYLHVMEGQLRDLLRSRHDLAQEIREGRAEQALSQFQSGAGFELSGVVRDHFRETEDQLDRQLRSLNDEANRISERAYRGLWISGGLLIVLGLAGARLLTRSITDPIVKLQAATRMLGQDADVDRIRAFLQPLEPSGDELGELAESYLDMASRISTHLAELEALLVTGMEINAIGPDGLDGVLRRITDRAVELVGADVCLVLLRNDSMGCWVIDAGSGFWDDRLKKSVMLWEEFPVCVQAYESGELAVGERLRSDLRPEVLRRNLIGDSMLAIPLRAQGKPFGVLALLSEQPRAAQEWNQRLAKGLAQEAAMAISNARLYEAAQQRQRGLLARLRHLERLAETLAHDLKGPGERVEELARLLAQKFSGQIDERTARWLTLIQENGNDLVRRVEGILSVARVGVGQGSVVAVDPRLVLNDVLKGQAGDIERLHATIRIDSELPLVACHGAYLRQVFDNLISNALKFARPGASPMVRIGALIESNRVLFSVADNGIGVPAAFRERVFRPFVRLRQSDAAGSGIGLAIVQRIIELYGGRVWIDGDEGEGCRVTFTMPWLREEGSAPVPEGTHSGAPEVVDAPTRGLV